VTGRCGDADGDTNEKGNDMSDTIPRWSRSDDAMVEMPSDAVLRVATS
jgi:hypothetical protein